MAIFTAGQLDYIAKLNALEAGTQAREGGVLFPAAQVASSDPNCLDDYEEGTWTPSFSAGTGSITSTSLNDARYTKNGREIFAKVDVSITNAGTGGQDLRFAVPITASNDGAGATKFAPTYGKEAAAVGYGTTGELFTTSTVGVTKYDGANPVITGHRHVVALTYC